MNPPSNHSQPVDGNGSLEPLLLTAKQVARVLGIGRATVFKLDSMGLLPRPIRFGRVVRWDRAMLQAWTAAGAPPRERWEAMNKLGRSSPNRGNGA